MKDKDEDGKQGDEKSESQIPTTKGTRVLNAADGGVKVATVQ